jgi:hypothetical protein
VVETVNDALEAPAATETVPGTVRTVVSVLDSEMAMPPAGADWVSVIVPVDVAPPATVDGLSETALGRGPCEVSTADCVTPPPEPVMVAVRVALLAEVETGKLALEPPAGMVTDCGTVATVASELDSVTTSPPDGAVWFDVTTPVEPVPAFMVDGLSESVDNVVGGGVVDIGFRVRLAVSVTPPPLTKMVTTVCVETATVEMMKPPAAANCGTVTELGTWARSGRELESENVTSPFLGSAAVTRAFEP